MDKQQIPLPDLFTTNFMMRNTDFKSIEEFFEVGNWNMSKESLNALFTHSEKELDPFVAKHTSFKTWEDMLGSATREYVKNSLGF